MLLTIHATAGALIGRQVDNPVLAFILALCSHFILDLVPHGDNNWIDEYKGDQKAKARKIIVIVAGDAVMLLALLISRFYFKNFTPTLPVVTGVIGGILPDLLVGCHELSDKLFKKVYHLHFVVHDFVKFELSTASGLFLQIIVLGILLLKFF